MRISSIRSRIHAIFQRIPAHTIRRALSLLATLTTLSPAVQGTSLPPERLHFDHLAEEDGLSQGTVWDIHQDRLGFLWFATADGLNRFDGIKFQIWKNDPDNPESQAEHEVFRLFEDRSGALWLGLRNGTVDRFDRAQMRFRHFSSSPAAETLPEALVHSMIEDRDGAIWVATADGLGRLQPETNEVTLFRHRPGDKEGLPSNSILALWIDSSDRLWIGTDQGLALYSSENETFSHFRHQPEKATSLSHDVVHDLAVDRDGALWMATGAGLDRLRMEDAEGSALPQESWTFERFPNIQPSSLETSAVWSVEPSRDGRIWAGTPNGLLRLDPSTGEIHRSVQDPKDPTSLSGDSVLSLHEDRNGILWVGTHDGIDKYDPRQERFTTWTHRLGDPRSLSGEVVLSVLQDHRGEIWAGTLNDGLNRIRRDEGTVRHYSPDLGDAGALPHGLVREIFEDAEGRLWLATNAGLARLDQDRERFTTFDHDPGNEESLGATAVSALWSAPENRLWVGSFDGGVDLFDPATGKVVQNYRHEAEKAASLSSDSVYDLLVDRSGNLWVGTEYGLNRKRPEENTFTRFLRDRDHPGSLSHESCVSLYESDTGTLWVGTYGGGLNRFHPEDQSFVSFREKDGLANDAVVAITEDQQGDLWLATNRGLSRFDPRSETFRNYDSTDGLAGDVYGIGAAHRNADGELFFGADGLNAFFPQRLAEDPQEPSVHLTDFHLFYAPAPLRRQEPQSPLERSILFTDELTLSHRQYVFALEFAGLHYAAPHKNRYAYRLFGFDEDWVEVDALHRRAQYSNLQPGSYTFQVRASNQDGQWNDEGTSLRIHVLPPPWKTWWAFVLYALTAAALLGMGLHWQHRRVEEERSINHRLREVDRLKDEFLANTSHELRTPLYGIIGLAEALSEGVAGQIPSQARGHLDLIMASGRRLSSLVNDILDFSKLSRKSLDLDRRAVDLHSLTEVVLTLARPLLGSKPVVLRNEVPTHLPSADADENRLQQILLNLVGNGIKFTREGSVTVTAVQEEGRMEVRVVDTGIGIPEAEQEKIFEAFEQVDAAIDREHGGTGLGLAVTRQLVGLHGGHLWLESKEGAGSSFCFTLPVMEGEKAKNPATQPGSNSNESRPALAMEAPIEAPLPQLLGHHAILVVDDEPVIREVLRASLAAEGYEVHSAENGPEALELLEQEAIDLVLLDVMMPRMSGYEVCRSIRQNHDLEDLPVIFLTARSRPADRLTGFSEGANDYLAKPVARGELVARVKTHLALYDQHKARAVKIQTLHGLIPICGGCKKIRDDDGYWNDLESYLQAHSDAELSHGLCPECIRRLYPELTLHDEPSQPS